MLQIPRLLGNQDRNPYSPTYGSFHRDYWLDKTSDFPDAVRQFGVQALALVYKHEFPGNVYKGHPLIRDWTIAGLDFWASIQHNDGSFDEFYPNERGWVGPTGFTTYASAEAYRMLQDEIPPDVSDRILSAIRKSAVFISRGQSEEDHLANHYAMACLAVWKSYLVLGDPQLETSFRGLWQEFLKYFNPEEGWTREYDGVDPGYLSATVSFLAKIYQDRPDPEMLKVLRSLVEFSSYFAYPDGFFGGTLGSRNTSHFYPHGYELLGDNIPMAAAVSEKMLQGLAQGKLVPPEIMSDRYVVYRVPEYLQAYIDYKKRPQQLPALPYERPPFTKYFPQSRVYCSTTEHKFVIANLAKGGVVRIFDRNEGTLLIDDAGIIGRLADGRVVTSQWIDPKCECRTTSNGWQVRGSLHVVPSGKPFSPTTHFVFRAVLISLGWIPKFSHLLKAGIRRKLMLGQRPTSINFERRFSFEDETIKLTDKIWLKGKETIESLSIGGGFTVRYVPQSRYFQELELIDHANTINADKLRELNEEKHLELSKTVPLKKSTNRLDKL